MKNPRLLLLVILQCCCFFVYPQKNRITFEHIGTSEGLSQSNILSIIQDSRGFMWFGSWDGLNKYDGYKITVYKNNPLDHSTISNNYINKISEGPNGNLWIATNDGLNYFDRKLEIFKTFRHNPSNSNSIRCNYINELFATSDGKVWIGTTQGLDRYDPALNKFDHINLFNAGDINANKVEVSNIYEDTHHNVWVSFVSKGTAVYNPASNSTIFFLHNDHNSNSIAGNHVNAVFEDSKHRIWIGTNGNGLDLYDAATNSFRHFKHNKKEPNSLPKNVVLAINEDAENNIWVGTENAGLSVFNYGTGQFINYQHDEIDKESISNNSIYCIYRDSKKNMWLGNFAGWVDMSMLDKHSFPHFKKMMSENSLSNNQVLSIMEDHNHKIWIGTDGGGLNIFDPATGNFSHLKHADSNPNSICGDNVLNTLEDSKGNTWIGTWIDGITVLDRNKNVVRHFKHNPNDTNSISNNNAWKFLEDRQNHIWIGTYGGGLQLLNPDGKSFTHYIHNDAVPASISGNNITNLFEDSEGYIWACAENAGLNRLDTKSGKFIHFVHDENKNSISNNNSNSLYEDEDHNLWIATMNGLNCYDKKNNRFTVYSTIQGLAGDYVFGILEDGKKNLWLSTNKGVSCFNRFTKSFKNFGVTDGLQSNEFKQLAFCKTSNGTMYFGGINGFNMFNPYKIKKVSFDPPLVITNFTVFNKQLPIEINSSNPSPLKQSITETKSITLPYSSSVFSFEFASLNYTSNEKKQYAYMLEGFDKEWNQAGSNRTATYTNLDPGKYVFKVRGLDNQGAGSLNITSVELVIEPPFWLTWWFKLLVLVAVTGGIAAFYMVRVIAVEKQKMKLEQQVSEKTQQLQQSTEQERKARQEAEIAHISTILVNKELEASEQRYSSMFHSSPQPMYVFDIDTLKFFQVNKAAVEHYGYTEEEFLNMNIMDIRHGEDRLKVLQSIQDFKTHHDRIFSGRFRHLKKSGEMMEVEIYSSLITINGKEYMLIIAIDITDKLLFENKLTKAIIKTQEDERYEIGGELHDNICQLLATSQLNISMLKNSLPASAKPFYEQGRMHIKQALDEIRNLSHRLAPAFFDEMTLEEAFRLLIETFNVGNQYNISLYFYKSVTEVPISRDIQLNLYRILQEQLRNIAKYSNAKDISVDLMLNKHNELVMQTSDDGIGFNAATNKCGIGFANMKRRAELFSGTIRIDSSPGNGCNITVTIPLTEKQRGVNKKGPGLKSSPI
jgi:PAS domain S-box-containing protein